MSDSEMTHDWHCAKCLFLRRYVDSASISLFMDDPPEEKRLRTASFVIHATRGVIRDQNTRRKTMFILIVIAMVLLFSGSTFLASLLKPHEHPGWFILFWGACAWLTLTALLLAVFDLLMIRVEARKGRRVLHQNLKTADSPRSTTNE